MTTFTKIALLSVGATVLIGGSAFANPKADTNQDGQVTKAEFVAAADARFAKTDSNGDGLLSEEERKLGHEQRKSERHNKHFERLDSNGDGVITRAEFDALAAERSERRKGRWDLNEDGQVDKEDRAMMKERRKNMREKRKEMRKHHKGMRKHHAEIDSDGDGLISLAEHKSATEAMFLRLDVNGDGVLTEGEGRKGRHHKRGR